jgi:hypothetical protein
MSSRAETSTSAGSPPRFTPDQGVTVEVRRDDGTMSSPELTVRMDAAAEEEY